MNLFVTWETKHPSGVKDVGTKFIEWNALIEYETDIDDIEEYIKAETGWPNVRLLSFSRLECSNDRDGEGS